MQLHLHLVDAFFPKRLTMYTHFTFTVMAHCTSGAIRGSVSCSRTLRQGIELATFCLLNDFSTSCTTATPPPQHTHKHTHIYTHTHTQTHTLTRRHPHTHMSYATRLLHACNSANT